MDSDQQFVQKGGSNLRQSGTQSSQFIQDWSPSGWRMPWNWQHALRVSVLACGTVSELQQLFRRRSKRLLIKHLVERNVYANSRALVDEDDSVSSRMFADLYLGWPTFSRHQKHKDMKDRSHRGFHASIHTSIYKEHTLMIFREATFYSPIEARVMPAPISHVPGEREREFVVDSGASMHRLSNKDLSSDEKDTFKRSRHPTVVGTANGEVQTFEEAQICVHDLGLFVTVQLLDETPAVLTLGTLFEDDGYSYDWVSGQKTRLTKEGKTSTCKIHNHVPLVVPGLSTGSSSSSTLPLRDESSTDLSEAQCKVIASGNGSVPISQKPQKLSKNDEHKTNADDQLRDLPEWLQPFTDNLEDAETLAPA